MVGKDEPTQTKPFAACPRCGYDQSGEVARWQSECPLDGRCTECGLGFEWWQVMRPGLVVPRWSYEHGPALAIGRAARTVLIAWLPWVLCRKLRMDHAIVTMRLITLAALALVLAYIAGATIVWWNRHTFDLWTGSAAGRDRYFAALLNPYGGSRWFRPVPLPMPDLWWMLSTLLIMPVTPLLMPWTMRRLRVRRAHLVRLACLWLLTLPLFWVVPHITLIAAYHGPGFLWPPASAFPASGGWPLQMPLLERWATAIHGAPWRLPIAGAAWAALWWFAAFHWYLRVPRAWLDAALLSILALGAGLLITLFWPGSDLLGEMGKALRLS